MPDMVNCSACNTSLFLSAATMTVEGMKCAACSAGPLPDASELTGPAGPMPGKLRVVVALLALSVLLNLLVFNLLDVAFGSALIFGIMIGNDGVRRFVVALAWLGLAIAGFTLALLLGTKDSVLIGLSVFGVLSRLWIIWSLMQDDVRNWMFKTAFKGGL